MSKEKRKRDKEMRRLYDERCVAEGEEAVSVFYRIFVYGKDFLPTRQTRNQHNQGAFGQVEIRN